MMARTLIVMRPGGLAVHDFQEVTVRQVDPEGPIPAEIWMSIGGAANLACDRGLGFRGEGRLRL
jgi:hypothetical protein